MFLGLPNGRIVSAKRRPRASLTGAGYPRAEASTKLYSIIEFAGLASAVGAK
jgi:hypothetical protein